MLGQCSWVHFGLVYLKVGVFLKMLWRTGLVDACCDFPDLVHVQLKLRDRYGIRQIDGTVDYFKIVRALQRRS